MIKMIISVVLLLLGLAGGYWLSVQFRGDETDKIYVSLEKAVAQSKFNLVKDNYMEFFYLCEQDNPINNWKALMLATYTFQYGVDAKNIALHNKGKNNQGKNIYTIEIKKIEMLSSEVSFMRTFTLEGALFKNQEKLISESKDDLIKRRLFLAELRLFSHDANQIKDELKIGITNTVTSLAGALGEEIIIDEVIFPEHAASITHVGQIRYQCGDINPILKESEQ
jgi:hypothetical protein